jgi:hypothetical protein
VGNAVPLLEVEVEVPDTLDVDVLLVTAELVEVFDPVVLVEVFVPDVLTVLDFVLEVDDATVLLLLGTVDASSYISSLLPAPQYSY